MLTAESELKLACATGCLFDECCGDRVAKQETLCVSTIKAETGADKLERVYTKWVDLWKGGRKVGKIRAGNKWLLQRTT